MASAYMFVALLGFSMTLEISSESSGCAGATWVFPSQTLCWAPPASAGFGTTPSYHCMWFTMEKLSGWPNTPRKPEFTCDELTFDCEHSLICTVLLEYQCIGPGPCWGTDEDRSRAEACLRQKCPAQAAAADQARDSKTACPVSGMVAGPKVKRTLWNGMYDATMPHIRMSSKTPWTLVAAGTGGFVALMIVAAFAIRQRRRTGASRVIAVTDEEEIE